MTEFLGTGGGQIACEVTGLTAAAGQVVAARPELVWEIAEAAARHPDVLIPFGSIDPHRGIADVRATRRLVAEHGVRGFEFHPSLMDFTPNDRAAYPL